MTDKRGETPETDAAEFQREGSAAWIVQASFARRLERERNALREALKLVLPMAEQWSDGKGRGHPDHDAIEEAKAALTHTKGER